MIFTRQARESEDKVNMDEFSSALQHLSSLHDAQIKGEGLIAHDYSHKIMYQRKIIMKSLSL